MTFRARAYTTRERKPGTQGHRASSQTTWLSCATPNASRRRHTRVVHPHQHVTMRSRAQDDAADWSTIRYETNGWDCVDRNRNKDDERGSFRYRSIHMRVHRRDDSVITVTQWRRRRHRRCLLVWIDAAFRLVTLTADVSGLPSASTRGARSSRSSQVSKSTLCPRVRTLHFSFQEPFQFLDACVLIIVNPP